MWGVGGPGAAGSVGGPSLLRVPDLESLVTSRFRDAIVGAFGSEHAEADPVVRPPARPEHGDLAVSAAMALARRVGMPPRDVARRILEHVDLAGITEEPEIAGPGFINLRFTPGQLAARAAELAADPRLGVPLASEPVRTVVDYSSPNIAKEMHVGHLRSTIIGDALVRVLEAVGHEVIRQNHIGDWGTQFGMLVQHLIETRGAPAPGETPTIEDLDAFYREANARFGADPDFADRARRRVVALQSGDPETLRIWKAFVEESLRHAREVYDRLGVLLTDADIAGESTYNDDLGPLVEELLERGIAVVDDGAVCVFPEGFTGPDGTPTPLIIRRADGGYLYATTDLAAIRHRVRTLGARRLIYVTDLRQSQHFAMVFATARAAGWLPPDTEAVHVGFGTVLGPDGRPLKSRSGDNIRLAELLDEAVARARAVVDAKQPDLPEAERDRVARIVGIGALKYADLSTQRVKDYVFDWDRMLALKGDTAPYLQYAHTRIVSILANAPDPEAGEAVPSSVVVGEPAERALVLALDRFGPTVAAVADRLEPHLLCGYLFELAQTFTSFYDTCPVLRAPEDVRTSRLVLCRLTAAVLERGLDLLGIEVPGRM